MLIDKRDKAATINPTPFASEKDLQAAIGRWPQVLNPVAELAGQSTPLFLIGRELNLGAGPMDFLAVDVAGGLYIIETKLAKNPEQKREVVGQVMHYAQQLADTSYEELDLSCAGHVGQSLAAAVQGHYGHSDDAEGALGTAGYEKAIRDQLKAGIFTVVIIGDRVPAQTQRLFQYLDDLTPDRAHFLVLEINQYQTAGLDYLHSNMVWAAKYLRAIIQRRSQKEQAFLAGLTERGRELVELVDATCGDHGLTKNVYPEGFTWKGVNGGSVVLTAKELRVNWTTLPKNNPDLDQVRLAAIEQARAAGFDLIGGASGGPKLKLSDATRSADAQRFLEIALPVIERAAQ